MATNLRPLPSSSTTTWSTGLCTCSQSAVQGCRVPAARRGRVLEASRGAAVLERTERIEDISPSGYELYTDRDWTKEFAEYTRATQQLEELASLQAQLMDSVQTMDSFLLTPQPAQSLESAEARRARRQQSRAARKAPTLPAASSASRVAAATAVVAAPAQDISVLATPAPQKPKRTPRSAKAATPAAASVVQQPQATAVSPQPLPSLMPAPAHHVTPSMSVSSGLALAAPSATTAKERHLARAGRSSVRRADATAAAAAAIASGKGSSAANTDGTTQFMKAATSAALLKPEEQKEVATVVKDFLQLKAIEKELKAVLKRAPTVAEWAKAAKADDVGRFQLRLQQGQAAKARMLKANYRLVIKVVKVYQGRGLSLQDLIAEGMQGLLRGVEKFEVDKGFRFSTYAHWWIRQAVTRAIQEQGRAVRLPYHIHEQVARISVVKAKLSKDLGRSPTTLELADAMEMTVEKLKEIQNALNQVASLEVAAAGGDDDGASEVKDMLADERALPDEVFADDMIKENLTQILTCLSPREASVLKMHWGLDGHKEMTLEEIGTHFNITRERVRQLEARAMRQLKEHQHKLRSVLGELQHMPTSEVDTAARSSRGTKKT